MLFRLTALTEASRMPSLDGQKTSKSYNNTITLREDDDSVVKKIRTSEESRLLNSNKVLSRKNNFMKKATT